MKEEIRTRLAPSPTGFLHIGTARTALFNLLFAKKHGGKFVLRIEDTDEERSKPEFEKDIVESLKWLGLEWDEFYRQSDRKKIHSEHISKLLESGFAYVSKEELSENKGRSEVIRFKNPNKKVKFEDVIRGEIETDTTDLGDFVIAKDLNSPVFHFAVVVDDALMKISHVIRGEDHISNTPRQILIQEALGFSRPKYAHLPLILGKDRSKLSKRHGAQSLNYYKAEGYPREAIVNFLALLGWHPSDDKEIFSLDELLEAFSLERIQKGGAVFDTEKLDWISREYIKKMSEEEFTHRVKEYIPLEWEELKIVKAGDLLKDRISKLKDFEIEARFIFELPEYAAELLIWKNSSKDSMIDHLGRVLKLISGFMEDKFIKKNLEDVVMPYANEAGRGDVLWPLRVSLSGQKNSPGPFDIMDVLGKEESLRRIALGITKLKSK